MSQLEPRAFEAGRPLTVTIVSDRELDNHAWLAEAKLFTQRLRVPRSRICDFLADGLRDTDTVLLTEDGNRAYIDLEEIEKADDEDDEIDGFEWWYKDWVRRAPPGVKPRLRTEARERVRLITTILRLIFPKETSVWGRLLMRPL